MKPVLRSTFAVAFMFSGLALAQSKGDAAKGKALFDEKAEPVCSVCHNADSNVKKMGPGLKGLFSMAKLKNGKKPTEANIKAIIMSGGGGMPGYGETLKPVQVDDLIAYLKTL